MEALPAPPKLPQPQRQVNKVLTSLVEKAVEIGMKKRRGRGGLGDEQEETGPAIEPSAHSEPLAAVRCLALSSDERHLFAGLASGHVIAVSATTGSTVATLEIGEGPINEIAQVSLRSIMVPEGGLENPEEEGGVSETEAIGCKVLVVAAGEKVMFFKVIGVLEDNTFIQFAAAQLPRGTNSEAAKPPPPAATPPQPLTPNTAQNGGDVKALGLAPDAGMFWASTRNGALAVFPMPSPTPPQEDTAETRPVTQLDPVFVLPPDSAAAAAVLAHSHSATQSSTNGVNTPVTTLADEQVRFLLRTASFREAADAKSRAPSYHCELYVWWEGRNRILMYEVPWKGSASATKKGALAEPRKAREWTMPHGVTSGALSADGSLMAVGMGDGSLVLLDLHLCLVHRLFQRLEGAITALAFTGQSTHRPTTELVVISSGGELKAHTLTGEEAQEKPAVAVRKGVARVTCLEGTPRALLFTNNERPAQLIDISTGAVLGSFAPSEGFVCPGARQNGTTNRRNDESTEQQTIPSTEQQKNGTAEREKDGPAALRTGGARLWAYSGGHVLVQIVQRIGGVERPGKVGGGDGEVEPPATGPEILTGQTASASIEASGAEAPSECLVFHSLHSGALFSHSNTFAGLFSGPQLLERMLQDSASVRGKPGDASRRPSIMQSSPRFNTRHVSTSLPLDPSGRLPYSPTTSRHVSVHEASGDSPRNGGHSSPRAFPFIRENSLVGVNKPLPLSQASLAGVNKPLAQGQLSLTRKRAPSLGAFTSSPRGDLASQFYPGGSPRGGGVKPGKIEGLPVPRKEEEPQVSVGYRDDVPAMLNRLSSKGGGRFAREQRMRQRREEMLQELATNKVAALT